MGRLYSDVDQPPGWAVAEAKDKLDDDAPDEQVLAAAREIANAEEDR